MTTESAEVPPAGSPPSPPPAVTVRFLLNDREVTAEEPPALLVLDYLRRRCALQGTKEGCREGDCGACVVLLGELDASGQVSYRPVTSCLLPVAELHGKHLVTIEGLDLGQASPVQERIAAAGAAQCGFCTPGIVVSLTAMALDGPSGKGPLHVPDGTDPRTARVERYLSGHLCRCTGYRSLRQAGLEILDGLGESAVGGQRASASATLSSAGWLPGTFEDAPRRLAELADSGPAEPELGSVAEGSTPLAGGTDLYVQRGDELARRPVRVLAWEEDLRTVEPRGDRLEIGPQATFEDLSASEDFVRLVPGVVEHMHWIASLQVRHRSTVGGNLVNASPIGDVTVLLLALGARLRLRGPDGDRELPLDRFYLGYKNLDLRPGEIVQRILLDAPRLAAGRVTFKKVSKRKCLDIASVNGAAFARVEEGRLVDLGLAVGGVAPVPLYLREASELGIGRAVDVETLRLLLDTSLDAIAPIDDVRGSALYKRLLCRRILIACFLEVFPGNPAAEELAASPEGSHGPR